MPLEAPNLDVRTFEQLVREARLRIPRYTPEWTDFNDSDPGMALVQLFAWFTETLLYQMNRIPDRTYIKLLQLLNLELEPAQPATVHLTFSPQPGAQTQGVPRGAQVVAQPPDGGDQLIFETEAGLDLVRLSLSAVQVFDGAAFSSQTAANTTPGQGFRPLGWIPQVNSALYLGFAQTNPPAQAPLFPQQIRMRVFRPLDLDGGKPQLAGSAGERPSPPVKLIWEHQDPNNPQRWRRLNLYEDESVAFTREGYILLEGPRELISGKIGRVQDQELYWLRCRLESGSYPVGTEPTIAMLRVNVAPARNLATVREEVLGDSDGRPEQSFALERKPVLRDSLELVVEVPGEAGPQIWTRVDDFLSSGQDDQHYTLNVNAGEVRFGDGIRGRIPVASARIIARAYRYGGGARGNVAAGLVNTPLSALVGVERVTNERPAEGGRDEQAVQELLDVAPKLLRSRNRAVTPEDFTALAAQAGGVASAVALPLAHPGHPGVEVPGAITVVIVPDNDDTPPVPSQELIASVCRYLNERRLLTSELYVKGPTYVKISVEATVQAQPYASFSVVSEAVSRRLAEYLSPLRPRPQTALGQEAPPAARQAGWAFGQDLFPTNLYREILQVPDVAAARVAVFVNGRPHDQLDKPVRIKPDELVYGAGHVITVVPFRDQ